MSAQLASPSSLDNDNVVELTDGPGRHLRQARQARGLQPEQIAAALHLHSRQIAALEREDYDALPGPVFVVGYLRNYARLLGLEGQPLIDAYRASHPEALPPPSVRPAAPVRTGSGHVWVRLASLALVVALGAAAFNWWQGRQIDAALPALAPEEATADVAVTAPPESPPVPEAQAEPSSVAESAAAPSAAEPIPAPEGEVTAAEETAEPASLVAAVADPQQPQPEPATETLAAESPSPAPSEASEPEAATPQANEASEATEATAGAEGDDAGTPVQADEIVMTFSGPCWVDIRDSERKFKIFGEMGKGDRRVLEGKPPYSVILGNASVVEVTVAGAPYDLSGVSRGNVARFTLDPTQVP